MLEPFPLNRAPAPKKGKAKKKKPSEPKRVKIAALDHERVMALLYYAEIEEAANKRYMDVDPTEMRMLIEELLRRKATATKLVHIHRSRQTKHT